MLTNRNRLFISEYLKCFNGSEAVRKVYPNLKASNRYANVLLKRAEIKQAIEEALGKQILSKDDILKGITEISVNGKIESNRLRAYELLAKINNMLKENQQQLSIFQQINSEITKPNTANTAEPIDIHTDTT